jgi:hypothetical protein
MIVLMATVSCSAQRGVALTDPVIIGQWDRDSGTTIYDTSVIASAEWPEKFWVEALAEARKCSRVMGDLQGWHLYTVSSGYDGFRVALFRKGEWVAKAVYSGFTFPDRREIYVVQRRLNDYSLLKHEMLHAILAERGLDYWHDSGVADGMFARCFPKEEKGQ